MTRGISPPSESPHHAVQQAGNAPRVVDGKLKPIMNGTDTAIAMIASTTVTITASMIKAISRRAQWFWTFLSSLSNSKPVGDWTPMVPRTDAPHFEQKAESSRISLPHFQHYTKGYAEVHTSRHV